MVLSLSGKVAGSCSEVTSNVEDVKNDDETTEGIISFLCYHLLYGSCRCGQWPWNV